MKVRIGVGTGRSLRPEELGPVVGDMDELGFDSIWLSEILTAPTVDPVVGLAYAAAANPHLKLGTTMLLPGRHAVRLAKELATLDALSRGRLLLTFVPGLGQHPEREAVGVAPGRRGPAIDELLPLLRRLWAGERVTHHGEAASLDGVSLSPFPSRNPSRCGWAAWPRSPWSAAVAWPTAGCPPCARRRRRPGGAGRSRRRPGGRGGRSRPSTSASAWATPQRSSTSPPGGPSWPGRGHHPTELVPFGLPALRRMLEAFLDVGFSKFVVRPLAPPPDWRAELEELAGAVLDLQT